MYCEVIVKVFLSNRVKVFKIIPPSPLSMDSADLLLLMLCVLT